MHMLYQSNASLTFSSLFSETCQQQTKEISFKPTQFEGIFSLSQIKHLEIHTQNAFTCLLMPGVCTKVRVQIRYRENIKGTRTTFLFHVYTRFKLHQSQLDTLVIFIQVNDNRIYIKNACSTVKLLERKLKSVLKSIRCINCNSDGLII